MFDGTISAKVRSYWDGKVVRCMSTDSDEFEYHRIILLEYFYLEAPLDGVRQQIEEVRSTLHYEL
jgi:hypothetical protein